MSQMYERYKLPSDNTPLVDRTSRDAHSFTARDLQPNRGSGGRIMPDKNGANARQVSKDLLKAALMKSKAQDNAFNSIDVPADDNQPMSDGQRQYRQNQKAFRMRKGEK